MSELSALKAIADAAPEGPWVGIVGAATTQVIASDGSYVIGADVSRLPTHRYVCTFDPPTVKALLAVVEAAEYRQRLDDTCWCPDPVDDDTECGRCRLASALAALHDTEGR